MLSVSCCRVTFKGGLTREEHPPFNGVKDGAMKTFGRLLGSMSMGVYGLVLAMADEVDEEVSGWAGASVFIFWLLLFACSL